MNKKKISNIDINKVFIRSTLLQGSWNFERMQALGFCYSIIPVINKLYHDNKKEKIKAVQRHLEFFNTHPYMVAPILGVIIAMEEKKANGAKISKSTINSIKIGLMGPLAGIGDPIFWGTIRPILSALGASLSINGNIIGPIIFFLSFNIIRISTLYYGIHYGYNKGLNIVKELNKNLLNKLTEGSSILGLFIIGALVSKWTKVNIPVVVSNIQQYQSNIKQITTIQNILDQLIPGLIPLLLTLTCMWLLKKKINPLLIMMCIFIISIAGNFFKILQV